MDSVDAGMQGNTPFGGCLYKAGAEKTMSIVDMIPTLDDAALASLRSNATRLEASGKGLKQKEAASLLPLIDAELAQRQANKPVKVKAVRAAAPRRKAAAKVVVEETSEG